MYNIGLEILKIFHNNNKEAYIVGGFARDLYLGITSNDIDITTNAKKEEIESIFKEYKIIYKGFLSYTLYYKGYNFEITSYRKEIYLKNGYPKVEYAKHLEEDLKRRDFTINTLCIDYLGNYVDLLGAKKDLDNKIIKCVSNSDEKIKEDARRILRAIRFSLKLNFKLDEDLIKSINKYKHLLLNFNKNIIKKELDEIKKYENADKLLNELGVII